MQFKGASALCDTLVNAVSSEELQDLAFAVGVDYDALPGDTKQSKASELILYTQRRGQVDQILGWLSKNRPDIDTQALMDETPNAPPPPTPSPPPTAQGGYDAPRRRPWKADNLDLRVETATDGGYVISAQGPAGEAIAHNILDVAEPAIKDAVASLRSSRSAPTLLQSAGARLFDFLFADKVGDLYRKTVAHADRNLDAVRLRLSIAPVELSRLPWECLYDPRLSSFLAVRGRFALTHTVDVGMPATALAEVDRWRVLLLLSSPGDVPPLDLDRERKLIEMALSAPGASGRFEIDVLVNPTLAAVDEALRQQAYHIVHYTGHGVLAEKDTSVLGQPVLADQPYLVLSNDAGRAALIDGATLAQLFAASPTLSLAFLNTQAGPGEALLRAGQLLAVISMRFPITDKGANIFAREFYRGIAGDLPLAMALTQARIALYQELGATGRDWVSPVLTTRAMEAPIASAK